MTISAGMAEYPTDGEGMRDLIAIADRAMYTAVSYTHLTLPTILLV